MPPVRRRSRTDANERTDRSPERRRGAAVLGSPTAASHYPGRPLASRASARVPPVTRRRAGMSSREVRAGLFAMAMAVAGLYPGVLVAQGTGTVRGTVVESSSRRPISDVQILVAGSSMGAVTGSDGTFRLNNVPQGERVLRVRRLGFV